MNPLKVFINNIRKSLDDFFNKFPVEGKDFRLVQISGTLEQDFVELISGKWQGMKYGYGVVRIGQAYDTWENHIHYTYGVIEWPPEIDTAEKRIAIHDDPQFKTHLGEIALVLLNSHYKSAKEDTGWKKI